MRPARQATFLALSPQKRWTRFGSRPTSRRRRCCRARRRRRSLRGGRCPGRWAPLALARCDAHDGQRQPRRRLAVSCGLKWPTYADRARRRCSWDQDTEQKQLANWSAGGVAAASSQRRGGVDRGGWRSAGGRRHAAGAARAAGAQFAAGMGSSNGRPNWSRAVGRVYQAGQCRAGRLAMYNSACDSNSTVGSGAASQRLRHPTAQPVRSRLESRMCGAHTAVVTRHRRLLFSRWRQRPAFLSVCDIAGFVSSLAPSVSSAAAFMHRTIDSACLCIHSVLGGQHLMQKLHDIPKGTYWLSAACCSSGRAASFGVFFPPSAWA